MMSADPVADIQRMRTDLLNSKVLASALGEKLLATEGEVKSLTDIVRLKNEKLTKLEAENVRLKMQRTDADLAAQVEGLRIEVGKKDRELVELRRDLEKYKENEAIILRRMTEAQEKVKVMQTTMGTFQKARDAADERAKQHDQDRVDALRRMVDAEDRAQKALARVAELERRGKPVQRNDSAPKRK